ncbi:MAG TPA: glutamine amidotransferase [Phycisphaerae bacterium]|nr:glutamine amidotransferase [Phycisphaerae bacterium]
MASLFERFDRPMLLLLALVILLTAWMARRSLAGLGPIRGKLCLAMRSLVILLLVLAIAGMHRVLKSDDLSVLFLLDQSRSIPVDHRKQSEEFIRNVTAKMKPNDRAGILTFDGLSKIEQLPSKPGPDGGVHVSMPLADGQRPDRTNLAQGLRVAAACAMDSTNNRVVILSDGIQNLGDALEEAKTARANHMRVDVIPLVHEEAAEVVFEQIVVPPYANLHEQVPLRLIVKSDRATSGTILIHQRVGQDETLLDLNADKEGSGRRVTLEQGRNAFVVRVPIATARTHEFRAEFVPDEPAADGMAQNNVARAFTNVEGPKDVLFIGTQRDRADDDVLMEALKREGIRVSWEPSESVNLDTAVLQDYAAIVLSNVPADHFSAAQQQALVSYVRDLGGGVVMIGGDDSFAAGGWQGSPIEEIMPVKFDVDSVKQIPRGALAIVMHSCEMPQGNKWGIETAVAALNTVSRLDYYGVVGWGMTGFAWEVPMQTAGNKEAIKSQLRKMQNADMFDFDPPMKMAFQALMSCKDAAQRHMIIISDGDPQPPSSGLLNQMVGKKVTCSTVSIFPHGGQEIATMQNIANATGGRYYSLNKAGDEKKLPRIFVKEAKIVRRPLVRDEIFTPKLRPNLSEIMQGIDTNFPQLLGYVVTTPRKVVDVEMPLVTERGDPLLAHWRCGFGRTLAFTSGRWKHWGANWAGWPAFSKLWAQSVRWVMQQGSAANYDVSTTVVGDEGQVVIESLQEEGFANFQQFEGRAIAPDGTSTPVTIVQTGPGRYEGKFRLGEQGSYLLNVVAAGGPEGRPTMIRTGVSVAYSPEFRELETNEALLRAIADETNGRVLTPEADAKMVFAHDLPPTITRTPIWQTLLQLAVFAFLLDVGVRRIAIDPVRVARTVRGYIASLPGLVGAGRRATRTLAELKDVREKVRAERTAEGQAPQPIPGAPLEDLAPPSADAKFTGATGPAKPSGDLIEAMGGATAAPSKPPPAKVKKDEPPQEATTARLLRAKKRTRDQQDDGKK